MTFTGVLIKMSSWIKFKILWKSSITLKLGEFRRTRVVYTELFHQNHAISWSMLVNYPNQPNKQF